MLQHLPDLVAFFASVLPLCDLVPTIELSLPVEKVRVNARNVLLTANEMRISDKTILAKNLTLHADEISLTTVLNGMHLCGVFISLPFYA
uniref:Lipid-binding serum glycoprotein C-terminal domain-containing protein n=1 Tax=Parascaris equorum TaxID=6256 RepID=A0A914RH62_PAREQ